MVKMKVKVVGLDQSTMVPVVVITDLEERGFIPIMIGAAEANAINQGLDGQKPVRPLTHDLLLNMLTALNARLDRVVISDLREDTYYAHIYVKTDAQEHEIDCRPSDALALAIRAGCPIYISEVVAKKALITNKAPEADSPKPIDDDEIAAFRRFLDDATPDDFLKNLQG
ncbi:MAG TPA: bifunctional nuclease family protein [Firmicutes bacterium]|jgi:bifunctional DNase/RNase|nr:bifunctional nuclease family protein [Bacillota bacterium]